MLLQEKRNIAISELTTKISTQIDLLKKKKRKKRTTRKDMYYSIAETY
jgi:hypothetical protein